MKEEYSKQKTAEILFTFVKLYENFQFSFTNMRKFGVQFILTVDFSANLPCEVDEDYKKLILRILDKTDQNGCHDQALLEEFIDKFDMDYDKKISENHIDVKVLENFEKSLMTVFESPTINPQITAPKKIPKFVGAEIYDSQQDTIYSIISNELDQIKLKYENLNIEISEILKQISTKAVNSNQEFWRKPYSVWTITSYYLDRKKSIPDSEYLKKFIEGIEITVRPDVLIYVPSKLIMFIVNCPDLKMHHTIKVPSICLLLNEGSVGMSRIICENLFESYLGLGNLYLNGFFAEPTGSYCEMHKVQTNKETVDCYVSKITSKSILKAETKFFY